MLRISPGDPRESPPLLRLEGKLIGPWVDEFREACEKRSAAGGKLNLDLAAVTYVDRPGLELLFEMIAGGTAIIACSALVGELLHKESRS